MSHPSDFNSQTLLRPGTVLGRRYEILQILGEGGMGAVYRARDREVNRIVALKVIRPELTGNSAILDRFKQELVLSHQVTHKNVVRIYDMGDADGIKFITMEYIEGQDLRSLIAQQKVFQPEEAVEMMRQVCRALEAAHAVGVIHRDLKPQNIMRDKQGRVVVMDFGLARLLDSDGGMTQTGAIVGTMEYMSPEQGLGKPLDERSDLFAVGLIFYELLTGKMPYKADSALASLVKRTHERAVPVSDESASIPRALSDIVGKCLEPKLEDRYQHVGDILTDLEAWQGGRAAATLKFASSSRPWGQTIPWHWIGMITAVLVLAFAGMMLRGRFTKVSPAKSNGVMVLVADFTNHTGDPVFDGTLEPMFNVALEGASFINAYNRGAARRLAQKLPNPTDKLDEQPARLVALSQGISTVIAGEISRRGNNYTISAIALDASSGNVLAKAEATAANKDQVVGSIPKLVAPIRNALGDSTPESAQLERAGGARRSRRHRHAFEVERDQQALGLDPIEADVGRVRHPRTDGPVHDRPRNRTEDAGLQPIAKRRQPPALFRHLARRDARRHSHSDDAGDVFGPGAAAAFLASAGQDRHHPQAAPNPERTDALGPVELVRRHRQHVHAERLDVDRDLAGRLDRIRVKQRAPLVRGARQLCDRLNRPDFVVRVHHRDDRRVVRERLAQRRRRDDAALVDGEQGGPPPSLRQRLQRIEHRFVLDRARHEVPPSRGLERFSCTTDGDVVGFSPSAGEQHFRRLGTDQVGGVRARFVDRRLRLLTEMVDARRVAEFVAKHDRHPLDNGRQQRRRCVVVEIDALHGSFSNRSTSPKCHPSNA